MVILMIARFWTAHYPWSAHYPLALKQGISAEVLSQIAAVVERYGERGVAELVALIGGYTTACLATVVDNFPPLDGPAPPLQPLA